MFDLSGGAPCLDLANTVENRLGTREKDLISGYPDLIAWARQAELIDERAGAGLEEEARRHPRRGARVLAEAIGLREALFRLFSAVAAGRNPPPEDLAILNRALGRALAHLEVAPGREGMEWSWRQDGVALDRMLWPVARSAAEILTGDDRERVRECASETCRWLFVDRSRNRTRRWCDMQICGNRHKVRRHYARQRRKSSTPINSGMLSSSS